MYRAFLIYCRLNPGLVNAVAETLAVIVAPTVLARTMCCPWTIGRVTATVISAISNANRDPRARLHIGAILRPRLLIVTGLLIVCPRLLVVTRLLIVCPGLLIMTRLLVMRLGLLVIGRVTVMACGRLLIIGVAISVASVLAAAACDRCAGKAADNSADDGPFCAGAIA